MKYEYVSQSFHSFVTGKENIRFILTHSQIIPWPINLYRTHYLGTSTEYIPFIIMHGF